MQWMEYALRSRFSVVVGIGLFFVLALSEFQSYPQPNVSAGRSVVYTNKTYGFSFVLPKTWRGYSVSIDKWEGGDGRTYMPGETIPPPVKGPLIRIKHPLSTDANPRQDIPIMIITKRYWDLIQEGKLIVSAAPIGPREIGRNSKYVFALPARYNYAFAEGWKEVDDIIARHSLHPIAPRL